MPLPTPILDDRSYQQLRDSLVRRIPVYAPEWTDHNASDPGITLIELFSFLGEGLLYRFNQIPDSTKLAFLQLLQIPLRPATSARTLLALTTEKPGGVLVPLRSVATAGKISFESETELWAWPLEALGMARVRAQAPGKEAAEFVQVTLDALAEQASAGGPPVDPAAINPDLYTVETLPVDPEGPGAVPIDFGGTVDRTLWIPVLKTDKTDLLKLRNGVLNIGVVPADEAPAMSEIEACPGSGATTTSPLMVWQVSLADPARDGGPDYRELVPVGDTTRAFSRTGVVRLRLPADAKGFGVYVPPNPELAGTGSQPPPISDEKLAERVAFWLRAVRRDGGSPGRLRWIGINVTDVVQTTTAAPEFLGTGTGQPEQRYRLVNRQVAPGSLVVEVEDADGWTAWTEVDHFHASHESDKHFVLDREAGEVRFGSGVQGLVPQIGERIRARVYRYGGGAAGNVPAGAITKLPNVGDVKAKSPLPAAGGAEAESIAEGLQRIPGELRRHDRAVTASDFEELALATPGAGVGRADVLPLFHPGFPPAPGERPTAAGVVSVVVWPREDRRHPDAPLPERALLNAVCTYLDARRLVTTELYVIPPTYKKIAVAIGLEVKDGYGVEAVRRWVELAVRQFLAPLPPYGPTGRGWPLGRRVRAAELETAAAQVEGVDLLFDVNLAVLENGNWVAADGAIDLAIYEVPEVAAITVVQGEPLPAGAGVEPPLTGQPVPVPTIKEQC